MLCKAGYVKHAVRLRNLFIIRGWCRYRCPSFPLFLQRDSGTVSWAPGFSRGSRGSRGSTGSTGCVVVHRHDDSSLFSYNHICLCSAAGTSRCGGVGNPPPPPPPPAPPSYTQRGPTSLNPQIILCVDNQHCDISYTVQALVCNPSERHLHVTWDTAVCLLYFFVCNIYKHDRTSKTMRSFISHLRSGM